jgi:hypothetical protein
MPAPESGAQSGIVHFFQAISMMRGGGDHWALHQALGPSGLLSHNAPSFL